MLAFTNGAHFPVSNTGWLSMLGIIVLDHYSSGHFLAGLEIIGPTNAAMLSTLEPIVTVLLAAWLFGEKLLPIVMVGGGFILAAVILLNKGPVGKRKQQSTQRMIFQEKHELHR